jgi:hypothetical protein
MAKRVAITGEGENTTGVRFTPQRWTISQAALDFNAPFQKINTGLRKIGAEPDSNKTFSTLQICAAIYSSYELERIEKMRREAEDHKIENLKKSMSLVSKQAVLEFMYDAAAAIRQIVMSSQMDKGEKEELCQELEEQFTENALTRKIVS